MADRFRPDAALIPLIPLDMRAEYPDEAGSLRLPIAGGRVVHFPNGRLSSKPFGVDEIGYTLLGGKCWAIRDGSK
jgi:hypothetical protein